MLTLRAQQVRRLSEAQDDSFVRRMAAHARQHFPACASLSDRPLFDRIWAGVDRAAGYGFVSEQDACKFLALVFLLGDDFDRDPRFAWMAPDLDPDSPQAPGSRIHLLCVEVAERAARGERAA